MIAMIDGISEGMAEAAAQVQASLVMVLSAAASGPAGRGRLVAGAGAGVIWDSRGLILTNNHVVGRREVRVVLADGSEYPARLVGRDPEIDLALLQIDRQGLPAVRVADIRKLSVGQLVFAIGHPWGQRGFTTAGVIGAISSAQTRGPRGSVPIVRTDAALAPGNSGGSLVDAAGEVVGINTMIVGGDQGVAIPASVAAEFVAQARGKGQQETARAGYV